MLKWLEERIAFKTQIRKFLNEPLPDRIGWPHVLGSILLALLAVQFITGILLSFLYAPSPVSAYRSMQYLISEFEGGAWIRSVHYWTASALVMVAALHLIRTFLYAAYRRPRELTWIAGVFLLLCILAFGQTGYLLPWDQRAYWGTEVTIQIISTVPLIGHKLAYILRGGHTVGAFTLSRFFSFHTILLPIVTLFFVGAHLVLIRRYGITAPWSRTGSDPPRLMAFYPYQAVRDAFGMAVAVGSVLILAFLVQPDLGRPADPSDTTFVPRPDWYFYFLFQTLHYFEGKWQVIGTFVIPTVGIAFLILLPFFDRNPRRELRYRPLAFTVLLAGIGLWSYLTYEAVSQTPRPVKSQPAGIALPRPERIKRPAEVGGMYLLQRNCFECHSMTVLGERPDLQTLARTKFPTGREWFEQHFLDQGRAMSFTDKELQEILSALRLVTGDRPEQLYTIPREVRFGAHFFFSKACVHCHKIDGQGGEHPEVPSPDLTRRPLRTKDWHIKHIRDPRSVVRKSEMPPFLHYEDYEYRALAEYLLYLHTP